VPAVGRLVDFEETLGDLGQGGLSVGEVWGNVADRDTHIRCNSDLRLHPHARLPTFKHQHDQLVTSLQKCSSRSLPKRPIGRQAMLNQRMTKNYGAVDIVPGADQFNRPGAGGVETLLADGGVGMRVGAGEVNQDHPFGSVRAAWAVRPVRAVRAFPIYSFSSFSELIAKNLK
jgi:hypothetical protein